MFPENLPRRLIKMFTFVGETVLDPFLGSGTTTLAAKNLQRNSIGYELNAAFVPLIREKLGRGGTLFGEADLDLAFQKLVRTDFGTKINSLPYIFHDPIPFDKKSDLKKPTYGSRIGQNAVPRQEYHRIKSIVSPTRMVLEDGKTIRLIGLKENSNVPAPAVIDFLQKAVMGIKVFLKFDESVIKDAGGDIFVYLYLSNKTFINADLLKKGFTLVDTSYEFKYRQRFIDYCRKKSDFEIENKVRGF